MLNKIFLITFLTIVIGYSSAFASDTEADIATIAAFNKSAIVKGISEVAYGYAVFPTIGKGGLGIGAAHGNGRVYVADKKKGETSMTQVSFGFQAGGQAYSQVVFFEDERAFQSFTSGNFEFSAQASAVAITAGASAEANTGGGAGSGISGGRNDATTSHGGYRKGMAIFTIAKGGLMYEAALGGQKYSYAPL